MLKRPGEAILFEMLRSFTTLARTLNLSRTVDITGATRQTVRRHIDILEENKGEKLFDLVDRQYVLTEAGQRSLLEAEVLLSRGEAWLRNQIANVEGLYHVNYEGDDDFAYHLQQHHLSEVWTNSSVLLKHALKSWAASGGVIEDPAFAALRPYWMIFRKRDNDWLCVEVGEKSAFATWFSWTWHRSSIGCGLADMPGGTHFANLTAIPYQNVMDTGAPRLDHVYSRIQQETDGPRVPVCFQRLTLAGKFPDSSFALVIVSDRTYNVQIEGVSDAEIKEMPSDKVMDFKPEDFC